jgi:hypothetical protein
MKNSDDGWEKIINEDFIYYNYSDANLTKILKYQNDNPENRLLLIFDDTIGAIDFNSQLVTRVIF